MSRWSSEPLRAATEKIPEVSFASGLGRVTAFIQVYSFTQLLGCVVWPSSILQSSSKSASSDRVCLPSLTTANTEPALGTAIAELLAANRLAPGRRGGASVCSNLRHVLPPS